MFTKTVDRNWMNNGDGDESENEVGIKQEQYMHESRTKKELLYYWTGLISFALNSATGVLINFASNLLFNEQSCVS